MAKNKIVYAGTTLIDLTADTVTADKLASGYTAHDMSGAPIVGTMTQGGSAPLGYGYIQKSGSNSTSITFSGLNGEPKMALIQIISVLTGTATRYVIDVFIADDLSISHHYFYESQNKSAASVYHEVYKGSATYSNGELTVTISSASYGIFKSGVNYVLHYYY